jgi:hypothetical protein
MIVDGAARRLSILAPDLEYVASVGLPTWLQDAEAGPGGGLFINAPSFDRSPAGSPVLRITREGTLGGSYGETGEACSRNCSWKRGRLMIPDSHGVWVIASYFTPTVERWELDGRLTRRFAIGSDWFPSYDSIRGPTPNRPPQSAMTGAWIDAHGQLWTLGQTADPEWAKGLGPATPSPEGGGSYYPVKERGDVVNAFIEVRDTATGSLIARRRFDDAYYLMHIDRNVIGRVRDTEDGWVLVDLLEVELTDN